MQTMVAARKVTNPGGISGRNPDQHDKLVFIPFNCPFNIIKEMGSVVLIAVREKDTKAIVTLFVQYRIVWTFSTERS